MTLKCAMFHTDGVSTVLMETDTSGKVEGFSILPTDPKNGKRCVIYEPCRSVVYNFLQKKLAQCACFIYFQLFTRVFCSSPAVVNPMQIYQDA